MASPWILESKLDFPSPPGSLVRRRLVTPEAPLPGAVLLVAGPGYGKTVALRELADTSGDGVTVWYSLDEYDADPVTFFHYLVAGMRRAIPRFGEELLALLAGEQGDPRRLWQTFFQLVASFNLPGLRLVLDDLHVLHEDDAVLKALFYFLDRLPPRTHVLMASRRRPAAPTARLEVAGTLWVFDESRLRFTPEEELAVLGARAPGGQVPEAWRHQALALDGWPLGICQIGAPGRAEGTGPLASLDLVAREVFEALPPDKRIRLAQAALLPELSPEAVEAVFGWEDAHGALSELEADQLLTRLGTARYRLPAYMAAFLSSEARHAFGAERLAEWHRRAAEYFRAHDRHELALPHLTAAEDWEAAVEACVACFPAMRFGARRTQIERWIQAFPPALRDSHPQLMLWRGHLASSSGDTAQALALYQGAQRAFEAREDAAGSFKVLVRRCGLAFVMQEAKTAGRLLLQAIARSEDGLAEDLADLALTRALAADLRGDVALMRECNQAALAVPIDGNVEIAASHCNAHINMYTLGLLRGELGLAERHIAEAQGLAEAWGFQAYALTATFLLADVRLTECDVDGADALIRAIPAVWADVLDWHGRACAQVVMGQLAQARGEYGKAEASYRQAMATFEAAGFKEGIKVPLERLAWLALHRRQYARVEALLAEAGPRDDASLYDLALRVPHGRALHLQGRHEEAIATLEQAVGALASQGAALHLTRAQLYLAAARLAGGDRPGARRTLEEAELAIADQDYGFLRRHDLALWEELAALGEDAPRPVGLEEARGLQLRFLGTFEVLVDGVLVDHWPRKKARLILAALALYPRGLTIPELLDAVGETNVTATTINSWQVVMVALRRTLEPTLPRRAASRFILHQGDRYLLEWEQVALLDRNAFLEAASEGDRLRESAPEEAASAYAQAVGLYRGHLLDDVDSAAAFDADREYLKQVALSSLSWLADHHQTRADEALAEGYLRRAIELAPTDESVYLALMRAAVRWGRLELVRQTYWDCRKALKARLGLAPSPEFEETYRAMSAASPEDPRRFLDAPVSAS